MLRKLGSYEVTYNDEFQNATIILHHEKKNHKHI